MHYNTSAQPKLIHCWTNRYLTKCVVPLASAALSPLLVSSHHELTERLTLLMQSPHNLYGSILRLVDSDLV
jgi:hypothetical protein